eukprot:Opistho-1_new@29015
MSFSMPYLAIAASVSPPPAMLKAGEWAIAAASVRVPPANWSYSNTPIGPFQTTVPARAMMPASSAAVRGPMSRIRSSGRTSVAVTLLARAMAENSSATTTSIGIGTAAPRAFIMSMMARASSTRSGSASDLPIDRPTASMNVLAMPPPTIS